MSFPHEIFKAYDIRGVVDVSLTGELMELLGRAVATQAKNRGEETLIVGRDGRLSGPRLAEAFCAGASSTGCHVIDIGEVPTPVLYFATVELGTGTGVQITGSHNPPQYNGLKMMISGETLSGEAIQGLKRTVLDRNFRTGSGTCGHREILPRYLARLEKDITLDRPMKVVIDCGNGVAGTIAPQVFRAIGCEVHELFCEVDGTFPNHHPDPSRAENLQDLINAVQRTQADFGMAFDGDGDRLGVVSKDGTIVWPDRQMMLFVRSILSRHRGSEIIFDVKCSQMLPRVIRENGGIATMWKTGHSFIKKKLAETGAVFAGEMSGHFIFNDRWGGFDDGVYAGARLCELLSRSEGSPEAVFAALPDTVNTPELRLDMAEGEPHALIDRLVDHAVFDDAWLTTIDGIRVDFDDGFGLIRASNTTPTLIMRFEASDQGQLERIQARFRAFVRSVQPDLVLPF